MGSGMYLHMVMPPSTDSEMTAAPCPHLSSEIEGGTEVKAGSWETVPVLSTGRRDKTLDLFLGLKRQG